MIAIAVGTIGMVPKHLERRLWELEIRGRPYKPQYCWDQLEYFEESWRPKETFSLVAFMAHFCFHVRLYYYTAALVVSVTKRKTWLLFKPLLQYDKHLILMLNNIKQEAISFEATLLQIPHAGFCSTFVKMHSQ